MEGRDWVAECVPVRRDRPVFVVVARGEAWGEGAVEGGADCDELVVDGAGEVGDENEEAGGMAARLVMVEEGDDVDDNRDADSLLLLPLEIARRGGLVFPPPVVLLAPVPGERRGVAPLPMWDGEEEDEDEDEDEEVEAMGVNTLEATSGRTASRGIH